MSVWEDRAMEEQWRIVAEQHLRRSYERIAELEAALKEALDYIDDPSSDCPGPTLIVLAGRQLLQKSVLK